MRYNLKATSYKLHHESLVHLVLYCQEISWYYNIHDTGCMVWQPWSSIKLPTRAELAATKQKAINKLTMPYKISLQDPDTRGLDLRKPQSATTIDCRRFHKLSSIFWGLSFQLSYHNNFLRNTETLCAGSPFCRVVKLHIYRDRRTV